MHPGGGGRDPDRDPLDDSPTAGADGPGAGGAGRPRGARRGRLPLLRGLREAVRPRWRRPARLDRRAYRMLAREVLRLRRWCRRSSGRAVRRPARGRGRRPGPAPDHRARPPPSGTSSSGSWGRVVRRSADEDDDPRAHGRASPAPEPSKRGPAGPARANQDGRLGGGGRGGRRRPHVGARRSVGQGRKGHGQGRRGPARPPRPGRTPGCQHYRPRSQHCPGRVQAAGRTTTTPRQALRCKIWIRVVMRGHAGHRRPQGR